MFQIQLCNCVSEHGLSVNEGSARGTGLGRTGEGERKHSAQTQDRLSTGQPHPESFLGAPVCLTAFH